MNEIKIYPSVLAADYTDLRTSIKNVEHQLISGFHVDIMDAHFVPNLSFGPWLCHTLEKITDQPLDVHLMMDNAINYIDDFATDQVEAVTVHCECLNQLHSTIQKIKSLGKKAGLSINPGTPASILEDLIEEVDLILVMTVNPGFGGQSFLDFVLKKINKIYTLKNDSNLNFDIYVDGGINAETGSLVVQAGANGLIAGNSIFSNPHPRHMIESIYEHALDQVSNRSN